MSPMMGSAPTARFAMRFTPSAKPLRSRKEVDEFDTNGDGVLQSGLGAQQARRRGTRTETTLTLAAARASAGTAAAARCAVSQRVLRGSDVAVV